MRLQPKTQSPRIIAYYFYLLHYNYVITCYEYVLSQLRFSI